MGLYITDENGVLHKISGETTRVLVNGDDGGIDVEGFVRDKGFLRYNEATSKVETILPDENIDGNSDNMIANSAVFNYVNQVANSVSNNFYSKSEVDGIVENIYNDANDQFYNKGYIDDIVEDVGQSLNNVIEVAEGKTKSFTVSTLYDLVDLLGLNTSLIQDEYTISNTSINYKGKVYQLKQGDIFFIVDTSVPDYWVSIDDMKIYKMETTKVDLTNYVTFEQYTGGFNGLANVVYQNQDRIGVLEGRQVSLTQTQYDALVASGSVNSNVYYNIVEE